MNGKKEPTPFGRAIRVRLAELNMRQTELADILGTSRTQITLIIYGQRTGREWVDKICNALDMPVKAKWKKGA